MTRERVLDIRVHRKNMEVSQGLLDAAERKLAKLEVFLDQSGWVEIGFVEEQNPRIANKYHCEIVAHVKGHRLKVEGSAGEPLDALDRAAEKVDKQVRRLKDKRVRHRSRANDNHVSGNGERGPKRPSRAGDTGPKRPSRAGDTGPERPSRAGGTGAKRTRHPSDLPAIVEVAEVEGKPMTPVEAAMQLGVLSEDFLLFLNADTGRAAVVYRRSAGDYGLVEISA